MNFSDQMFLALLTNDLGMVLQVIVKILSGLFLSPDAIAIYVVFGLGYLAFVLKGKIQKQDEDDIDNINERTRN